MCVCVCTYFRIDNSHFDCNLVFVSSSLSHCSLLVRTSYALFLFPFSFLKIFSSSRKGRHNSIVVLVVVSSRCRLLLSVSTTTTSSALSLSTATKTCVFTSICMDGYYCMHACMNVVTPSWTCADIHRINSEREKENKGRERKKEETWEWLAIE